MTASSSPPRRKQLSDQLDRFDSLLDGLADGLNEAVADAAREGARAAVAEVLTALLADPRVLAAASPPPERVAPAEPRPSVWDRAGAIARQARSAAARLGRTALASVRAVRQAGPLGRTLTAAAVVGGAAGAAVLLAPAWFAASVAATAAAAATGAARLGAACPWLGRFRLS